MKIQRQLRKVWKWVLLPLGLLLLAPVPGSLADDRSRVSAKIKERTGHALRPFEDVTKDRAFSLPPGVSMETPLSEQNAVAIALWNNAGLQATLADLGLARADLIEAGLFVNPSLQVLLGVGIKPFELLLTGPIEALWQRPRRVAAAELNLESVCEGLVQNGIDLVRDVRVAHAELLLAQRQALIAVESAELRREIADLTQKRLQAGDIGELDARLVQLEALTAEHQAARFQRDVDVARERLRLLIGLPGDYPDFSAAESPVETPEPSEESALLEAALSSRPDLRAAELAIEAAGRRAGWQRSRLLALIAPLLSSKGIGTSGIKTGPGITVEAPVFNRNQGGISRAEAQVREATLRYLALVDDVEFEVRSSLLQLLEAQEALRRIRTLLLPQAEETVQFAEKAYEGGDISYLNLREAMQPVYEMRLSEANAVLRVRFARAQLERAVGRRL